MSLRSSGLATLVVGAPGADDDRGAVYVYTAENMGKASTNGGFSLSQRLTADDGPSLYNGQRSRGDRFGCSVAMDEDDIVIGVCGRLIDRRKRDATPERRRGQGHGCRCCSSQGTALCRWVFIERLIATNVGRGDRLGHRVAD